MYESCHPEVKGSNDNSGKHRIYPGDEQYLPYDDTVFVSDYIYGDADRYDELTECYRKSLACVDRALAAECDEVYEITYGMQERWK